MARLFVRSSGGGEKEGGGQRGKRTEGKEGGGRGRGD